MLAGLVKKYLQRRPLSTTNSCSSSADCSLATRRYLEDHDLGECGDSSQRYAGISTPSHVARKDLHLFTTDLSTIAALPPSSEQSPKSLLSSAQTQGSRILDLDHLRSLPKYL